VVILKNLKDVSWTGAKAMMTDPGFLKSLVEFDKDGLSDKQVKKVKTEYMKEAGFTYENIKNVSTAGAGGLASRRVTGHSGDKDTQCASIVC
jgi:dynein heavy chain